jgi:transposase-like protein
MESVCLTSGHDIPRRSRVHAQALSRRVPSQGARPRRRRRPIAQIAADLNISDQTIYGWRRQELIDTGQLPGLNRAELAELSAANRRIRELETEVAILKRARELLKEPHDPKDGTRP